MFPSQTTLTTAEQDAFELTLRSFDKELDEIVTHALEPMVPTGLAEPLESVLVQRSPLLPKRKSPPNQYPLVIVDHLWRARMAENGCGDEAEGRDGERDEGRDGVEDDQSLRRDLLATCLLYSEGVDVMDDLVDGDVSEGDAVEVFLLEQFVLVRMFELASRVHPDAPSYLSAGIFELTKSFALEGLKSADEQAYLEILSYQSALFGRLCGLVGVVSGMDERQLERYEQLGQAYYKYAQFLRDLEEVAGKAESGTSGWNAWLLMDDQRALGLLAEWRTIVKSRAEEVAPNQSDVITGFVSIDVPEYRSAIQE